MVPRRLSHDPVPNRAAEFRPASGRLKAENRKLRAALEHERRMRTAEVDAAERRGRAAREATEPHRVLPGLLG